jgi:hypothetical protein
MSKRCFEDIPPIVHRPLDWLQYQLIIYQSLSGPRTLITPDGSCGEARERMAADLFDLLTKGVLSVDPDKAYRSVKRTLLMPNSHLGRHRVCSC